MTTSSPTSCVPGDQMLVVRFKSSNPVSHFKVMPPGSDEVNFIDATSGDEFTADPSAGGECSIGAHLMRYAARRGESAFHALQVGIPKPTQ